MARASWRWAVVAVLVGALCAAPSLAGALPADAPAVSAAELVKRIAHSPAVGWSGYAEATGTLSLPDVDELADLPALLGGTTRMRGWWRGPSDWRVATLSLTGEVDTIRDEDGSWTWESANLRATRVYGALDVRLPQPPDLLPTTLGKRFAGAQDVKVSALPDRRVAGRGAAGVRLTPRAPKRTTISRVDVWADARTGLPLRVEVTAAGSRSPAVTSTMLDLTLRRPSSTRTAFTPPPYTDVRVEEAPDLAARIDRFAPYRLPDALVGVVRSDWRRAMRPGGGLATYGSGLTMFTVLPLPNRLAGQVVEAVASEPGAVRGEVHTDLLNVLAARRGSRAYVLAGTVPLSLLDAALEQLWASPPPELGRP